MSIMCQPTYTESTGVGHQKRQYGDSIISKSQLVQNHEMAGRVHHNPLWWLFFSQLYD